MNGPDRLPILTTLLAELLATPAAARFADDPNRSLLATMIAGHAVGNGCLPRHLGLGDGSYQDLLADYFPFFAAAAQNDPIESIPEWSDLQKLLLDHRAGERDSELWIADIIATALKPQPDVSALSARVRKLADDFPLYEGLTSPGSWA